MLRFAEAELLSFDIDGTLTDATTWWAGPDSGWVQRYSVRDGEALLRIKQRRIVVPLSRNRTKAALSRMEGLGLDMRWLGVQDKITGLSTRTLFFTLEINRIDDAVLEKAFDASPDLARYRPWFAELRKARPYQLEDRVEELFHDKYVTGHAAWNRLFDETMAALEFDVAGETPDERRRKKRLEWLGHRRNMAQAVARATSCLTANGHASGPFRPATLLSIGPRRCRLGVGSDAARETGEMTTSFVHADRG